MAVVLRNCLRLCRIDLASFGTDERSPTPRLRGSRRPGVYRADLGMYSTVTDSAHSPGTRLFELPAGLEGPAAAGRPEAAPATPARSSRSWLMTNPRRQPVGETPCHVRDEFRAPALPASARMGTLTGLGPCPSCRAPVT